MSAKQKGKYRNESMRLKGWDYSNNAAYFITICTDKRSHFFGEIQNGQLQITPAGAIAHVLWHEFKSHSKIVELGEFVVMPDHVHGILIINNVGVVACNNPTLMFCLVQKMKECQKYPPKPIQFHQSLDLINLQLQSIAIDWACL